MSGRKRKLYVSDLVSYGLYWHSSVRGTDEHGKFTAYYLDKAPANDIREKLRNFENVRGFRYRKEYAPEIGGYILRIYDKCIKDV